MNYSTLISHQLFKNVPVPIIEEIVSTCPVRSFSAGETILLAGVENHILFVILTGELEVRLNTPDAQFSFQILAGECIGEMSIIERRLTSAWVTAAAPGELIEVPEQIFWDKLVPQPIIMGNILQVLTTRMRRSNQVLIGAMEQKLRYEQFQKELDTASKIQANILPDVKALELSHPQINLHAMMEPAKEVGGDFYDAFAVDAERICVAIGDVSGKGIAASLFMVRVMTLLRMTVLAAGKLDGVLEKVNSLLYESNADMMFVTLFVAILDVQTGRVEYSNGGHNVPLVSPLGYPFYPLEPHPGTLLGIFPEISCRVEELTLAHGDVLLLYTDGVTEAENSQKECFSLNQTLAVLNQKEHRCSSMQTVVNELVEAVRSFTAGAVQSDDITLLSLRWL